MTYETIATGESNGVATIRLSRPDQMNALSFAMIDELASALDEVESSASVRALVITGEGAAFCAGADLKEVLDTVGVPGRRDFLDAIGVLFARIRSLPMPVIGGLNGITMAGGLELALCCDVLIAGKRARIGDAHSNFGVFPGAGGAAVLPERIGLNNAKYLLFTGDALPASRLMDMGLVQEVVADDALTDRLQAFGEKLAEKSPLVLRRMKSVANQSMEMSQSGALQLELETLRNHFRSDDIKEGLAAFAEKRKPVFTGR
ncbi:MULTISPECIES: enoyl-CoA hydratase/isomerase family protein [Roseobacteraceae]|uniref:enoyl-CoA hydratase/isomerase family protein n=1 Tax=Roseobacteraceae TaxID=2854170 RepID=UPI00237FD558|nr:MULTISPECIES: enoyl-CoA hydratase/isomerase family protein [Roseobacteraceae]MDE4100172.1 enoyl-CoA hydratase/isomerase family protein [Phaeobacter gallaeciensis]MDE4113430.1 enoyl-CoA hydratase/isomerase family protein [Phaeobacter gallaeciensis]MDE4117876.1 enoyl-CoA hydratase/isomerase family protein [Phaeobacter gallaeciensis]MDE4122365.1 enoyl-CoA hydratase/isomerase family protein [Phaeobacter gallaeciensis]MDF1804652.1 enoyl-CoA hydratase/isomerase family protein [Thalassovita sp.]